MGNAPCCAHLRVSWRTRQNDDGSTTGWWECDSGCGGRFVQLGAVRYLADAAKAVAEGLRAEGPDCDACGECSCCRVEMAVGWFRA
jgi:hypothetical protein